MWLRENTELLTDTIMALLLSSSVAIGVIILSLLKEFRGELHSYLFGEILFIGPQEIWLAAALFAIVSVTLLAQLSSVTLLTAHEDMAHVCGVPVRRMNYLFVLVLTLAVALSIRLLGIILVTALIVIPAAAARSVSRNLRQQIVLSLLFGLISSIGGTMLSYQLECRAVPPLSSPALSCSWRAVVAACAARELVIRFYHRLKFSQGGEHSSYEKGDSFTRGVCIIHLVTGCVAPYERRVAVSRPAPVVREQVRAPIVIRQAPPPPVREVVPPRPDVATCGCRVIGSGAIAGCGKAGDGKHHRERAVWREGRWVERRGEWYWEPGGWR